ncbi:MAG: beta-galactosidase [Acidobacteriaceae bacterium]
MRIMKPCIAVVVGALMLASAGNMYAANPEGQLELPSSTLDRRGEIPVVFHLVEGATGHSAGYTGHATLHVLWTDSLGRVVEDKTIPAELEDAIEIGFSIDMSRAIAMKNHLEAELSLDGKGIKGNLYREKETASADFVAKPPYTGWNDYAVLMWQPYPSNLYPELKKLGINGGVSESGWKSSHLPETLIDNNLRWYGENLASDYYSEYHRWRPDRDSGWSFTQSKELYQKDPNSLEAFKRHPSFWDSYWREKIHDRLVRQAKLFSPYRPYYYSLGDETGIAELAAQWDFDFSDQSLVPMRRWLRDQYGSLDALNQEWGTHFTDWNLVIPMTTNQAMKQKDDNFASWGDFKNWMDISYADALKMGVDAVHEIDKKAFVSVGGGQMPGWGGYDYARITKVLNAIEPYDIGRNIDIIRSLNPKMAMLTTGFASGEWERHRVWYELLHGSRGLLIWDGKLVYVQKDGKPGPRGVEAGKYYNQLRDGEGALIINSHLVNNRIAVHYSQPSLRTQWMLEQRPNGAAWTTRSGEAERTDNKFMRLRMSWCDLIEDEGLQPNFVSYDQVEQGELFKGGYHVLVLPESSSLSPSETDAIRRFVAAGGIAIASGVPGTYDQHSRKLTQSSLADLFGEPQTEKVNVRSFGKGKAILLKTDITGYLEQRLEGKEGPTHELVENLLRSNGVRPQFAVEDAAGHSVVGIDTHVYANGGVRVIALTSNPEMRVNELGPPDFRSNDRFAHPVTVHLHLPNLMYVYDTRTRKALGQKKDMTLTIDPYDPTILAASDTPLPEMQISVPEKARRGSVADIAVQATPAQAGVGIFHVDVQNPQGNRVIYYSGNLIAKGGSGLKSIPFAANDAPGKWTITVQDMLSGRSVTRSIEVE